MMHVRLFLFVIATTFFLTACNDSIPTVVVTDRWLGKWNGPEGTFLNIDKQQDGSFIVIIQDLDGPASYPGKEVSNGLAFRRRGVTEVIQPGTGIRTGMKWLADKKDCLIVKAGEGYCRN